MLIRKLDSIRDKAVLPADGFLQLRLPMVKEPGTAVI